MKKGKKARACLESYAFAQLLRHLPHDLHLLHRLRVAQPVLQHDLAAEQVTCWASWRVAVMWAASISCSCSQQCCAQGVRSQSLVLASFGAAAADGSDALSGPGIETQPVRLISRQQGQCTSACACSLACSPEGKKMTNENGCQPAQSMRSIPAMIFTRQL